MPINNSKNKIINPKRVKKVDLIVGIPSLNEADNISHVAQQADLGLVKYFKDKKAVIVNLDHNSPDGTRDAFLNTKTKTPKVYISTPPGVLGKGNNFLNLFDFVNKTEAHAIAVVDADIESITPEWIESLINPILEGYDYVTPFYARSEYDGSITNHICYPLIHGLYGLDIRQPIGGDFSFSSHLSGYWVKRRWHKTTRKYGVDIFMTLHAIQGGFKIAQTDLGAKIHKPSAPKLGPMFSQVVTTLFKNIISNKRKWMKKTPEQDVPYFGKKYLEKPQTVSIDYKGMKTTAIFNFHSNEDILKRVISPVTFRKIKRMYDKEILDIDDNIWYKVIYDVIYAYDKTDLEGGLIEALKPLYFGRFVSYFKHTLEKPFSVCEQEIIDQSRKFWEKRSYLIRKYNNKEKKIAKI